MAEPLCDPREWQDTPLAYDMSQVHERIPQRHEMALLHGIVHHDPETHWGIGLHEARPDAFWVKGHVPGRPLMPAIVMVEVAAQLCAWLASFALPISSGQFFGFGGLERARFRGQVVPGDKMLVVAKQMRVRRNMATYQSQAFVDDTLVFEGQIIGVLI